MKTVNYSNVKKILEFGIKLKSDEEVFDFFEDSRLSFKYLREVPLTSFVERRHIIQRVPETISVTDSYYYYHESKWKYEMVQDKRLPAICSINRFCYTDEYRLDVNFYPLIKNEKNTRYNLLKEYKKCIHDYSGYIVTFKPAQSKNIAVKRYIHKMYMYSLISSVTDNNVEHYAIEDDA